MRVSPWIVLSVVLVSSVGVAEDELRPLQQATLLLKMLSFDRNLESRTKGGLKVAVVYRENDPESEAVHSEMSRALEDAARGMADIQGPIQVVHLPYTTEGRFESDLVKMRPGAVYVAHSLSSQINFIARTTRRLRVLTFTADENDVRRGLSVGLIVRDSRPRILVNLVASKSEGADLSSEMLRLAEVIAGSPG